MGTRILLLVLLLVSPLSLERGRCQGSAGSDAQIEPRSLVDLPTAGIIPHGRLALDMEFYQGGGVLFGASVGVFDRLLLGVSYGAGSLVGSEKPVWNPAPGFSVRVRILDENFTFPAIALGFDTQGKEVYIDSLSRYKIKSLGVYAVASKNYRLLGNLSVHGGANYSLERADGNKDPNLFAGVEKSIGPAASVLAEYNFGVNDPLGNRRGYLNMSLQIALGKGLTLGFHLKDIVKNQEETTIGNRTVALEYVRPL
jgi:hypothetical protein